MRKKKQWWLGVRENGNLEIKYLVSALYQPWIYAKGSANIETLLSYVESKGIDPRAIRGLPPFLFGKRFGKRR